VKSNLLGHTQVRVSALGFGAAPIGNPSRSEDDAAVAAVHAAWDGGVRYFDTAPLYGLGLSERRLGAALAGCPRSQFSVSTKVGRLLADGDWHWDFSRDGVRRSLEESLIRLGLGRVDIVYVHDPEDHLGQALDEAIPALVELRDQGVVGAVGAGMNYVHPLRRLVAEADIDVVMLAGRWTLLDRSGGALLAECKQRGVAVVAAAPFNSGLLSQPWPADDAQFDYAPAPHALLDTARAMAAECERFGGWLPNAAIQFPLRHGVVSSVVVGMASAAEVAADLMRATTALPDELWPALDKVLVTRRVPVPATQASASVPPDTTTT
jgi:D-threo-aldose 1-dehydrogenase